MQKYEAPIMDMVLFEAEDVIRTSGDENEGDIVTTLGWQ